MEKNARQHVEDVYHKLQTSRTSLTEAISTVEKEENRQQIQNTLNAVQSALQTATETLSNYTE
ncbi:MAG: EscE/YscE/SsaE family type III secretion system needle protein co-chaperone [Clostridium sp.]|uniref:EscE/YscE/SsaE family type III secretion system needle protein co-chaperone n=1 Tax=Clostridium sp. TaxID=1506 RepID=UPI003D6CD395